MQPSCPGLCLQVMTLGDKGSWLGAWALASSVVAALFAFVVATAQWFVEQTEQRQELQFSFLVESIQGVKEQVKELKEQVKEGQAQTAGKLVELGESIAFVKGYLECVKKGN